MKRDREDPPEESPKKSKRSSELAFVFKYCAKKFVQQNDFHSLKSMQLVSKEWRNFTKEACSELLWPCDKERGERLLKYLFDSNYPNFCPICNTEMNSYQFEEHMKLVENHKTFVYPQCQSTILEFFHKCAGAKFRKESPDDPQIKPKLDACKVCDNVTINSTDEIADISQIDCSKCLNRNFGVEAE